MPLHGKDKNFDICINSYDELPEKIIVVNSNRVAPNLMKRLNFSFAHEIGHIELEHEKIYRHMKWIEKRHPNYYCLSHEDKNIAEYFYFWENELEEEADEKEDRTGDLLVLVLE